jgi:hypothetical protein
MKNARRLRVGYGDAGAVVEGGGTVLNLVAGYLARVHRLLPQVADLEGLVYEVERCEALAREVKSYLRSVAELVMVRFEDSWRRPPLPQVECE